MIVISVFVASSMLLVWLGLGLSGVLPAVLRPWAPLTAPLLGYILLMLIGYAGVQSIFDLRVVLIASVAIATVLNAVLWRRWWTAWRLAVWREILPIGIVALIAFVASVLPLVPLGQSLPVGGNWDNEVYLSMADTLRHTAIPRANTLPANPLLRTVINPQPAALSVGFSILHGIVGLIVRRAALPTMYPVLCVLHALSVLAYTLLFRVAFDVRPRWAIFGAALTATFGLDIWIVLFGFGMQTAAMPLLPWALLLFVVALRDGGWRAIMPAGATFAAMPMVYYPAVVSFLPLAVPLGAVLLWQARERLRLILTTLKLAGVTLALGFWTIIDWNRGFAGNYNVQSPHAGVDRFITWQQMLGLAPYVQTVGPQGSTVPTWLASFSLWFTPLTVIATATLIVLLLMLFWKGSQRAAWLGMAGGAALYLLYMRFVTGTGGYPYGFLKASSTVIVPLLGMVAAGGQALSDLLTRAPFPDPEGSGYREQSPRARAERVLSPRRRASPIGYPPVAHGFSLGRLLPGLAVLPLTLALFIAAIRTATPYWSSKPLLYPTGALQAQTLLRDVPQGASLVFSRDTRLAGPTAGLLSYFALGRRVIDGTRTGFTPFTPNPHGEIGDFALLHNEEDPSLYGYQVVDRVGQTDLVSLYRKQAGLTALAVPPRPVMSPDQVIRFGAGTDGIRFDGEARGGGTHRIGLHLVAAAEEHVSVVLNGTVERVRVAPGGSVWWSKPLPGPIAVELAEPTSRVLVRAVGVAQPDYPAPVGSQPAQPQAVVDPVLAITTDEKLAIQATILTPERITLSLDIWDAGRGIHWGWYGLEVPANNARQRLRWLIDLGTVGSEATINSESVFVAQQMETRSDGDYTAVLGVSIANRSLIDPIKAFSFKVRSGVPDAPVAWTRGLFSVPVWQPETLVNVRIDDTELLGYTLPNTIKTGQALPFTLYWHTVDTPGEERSVLVHLRDAAGQVLAQGDGPPANGARPISTWENGQYIRDDRSLQLPENLPAGDYTLAIGIYRYPSLERLPLRKDDTPQPDDVFVIPLQIAP